MLWVNRPTIKTKIKTKIETPTVAARPAEEACSIKLAASGPHKHSRQRKAVTQKELGSKGLG